MGPESWTHKLIYEMHSYIHEPSHTFIYCCIMSRRVFTPKASQPYGLINLKARKKHNI